MNDPDSQPCGGWCGRLASARCRHGDAKLRPSKPRLNDNQGGRKRI